MDKPLLKEAKTVERFAKENKFKELNIVGISRGSVVAVNLASLLNNNPEVKVKSVGLTDPVGLVDQQSYLVALNFLKTISIETLFLYLKKEKNQALTEKKKEGISNVASYLISYLGEICRREKHPVAYLNKLKKELEEMSKLNPETKNLNIPVIITQGLKDSVGWAKKLDEKTVFSNSRFVKKNHFN